MGGMRLLREAGPLGGLLLIFALAFARRLLIKATRPRARLKTLAQVGPEPGAGPRPPTRRQLKLADAFLNDLPDDAQEQPPPSPSSNA